MNLITAKRDPACLPVCLCTGRPSHLSAVVQVDRQVRGKKGQGLLEIIVAIGVLSTGVISATTLMTSSLNSVKEIEARFIGTNLAREGIEIVRAIRDSNWLQSRKFDEFLEGGAFDYTGIAYFDPAAGNWSIDFGADSLTDDESIMLREANGLLRQAPASLGADLPPSVYRRLITLNAICDDGSVLSSGAACPAQKIGIEARTLVSWNVGPRKHEAEFILNLYDWR